MLRCLSRVGDCLSSVRRIQARTATALANRYCRYVTGWLGAPRMHWCPPQPLPLSSPINLPFFNHNLLCLTPLLFSPTLTCRRMHSCPPRHCTLGRIEQSKIDVSSPDAPYPTPGFGHDFRMNIFGLNYNVNGMQRENSSVSLGWLSHLRVCMRAVCGPIHRCSH